MQCRRCEGRPRQAAQPRPVWGADRISGLRCPRCGNLLDADDIAQLLLQKQSQLDQFGLLRPDAPVSPKQTHGVVRLEKD